MAFSKIVLTFSSWGAGGDNTGAVISFKIDGGTNFEIAKLVRTTLGEFVNSNDDSSIAALNYKNAWQADYAGSNNCTITIAGPTVTITANYDGAVFSEFSLFFPGPPGPGLIDAVITNVPFDPPLSITAAVVAEADANKCTTVKITLTVANGTPPYVWNTVLPGNVGLVGANVPRTGNDILIEIEDDDGEIATVTVQVPETVDNSDIDDIVITGDPSGLFGSVAILMEAIEGLPITWEFSLDGASWQSSNVFTSVLVGVYTLRVRDNYGCVITQEFEVSLTGIRPPVYRLFPKSNSFGWFEQQAALSDCTNPYNGTNALPNNYKPTRWYNPKYFQPWCFGDAPKSQFRSNYDTLTAEIFKIIDGSSAGTFPIVQKSNNLGQRQIMDATLYQRNPTQSGIYWTSGNLYDTDGSTVIGTYDLDGQLPEWVKVGQRFSLSGSAANGIFEIKQIIFDSTLLVNAAIIDRVYVDVPLEVAVKVDAVYNRLNYETYEFQADLSLLEEGCYKIILSMTDSLAEYPDSIWETFPFIVSSSFKDHVYIESSNHVDDGILYSTGIIHKQRFQGLFYDEDFPSTYETIRDSRKALNKLDGRVEHVFIVEAIDVPKWVHEKLALYISKKTIRINNLLVQFEEPWEKEKLDPTYSRVNLKAEAFVSNYEQYITNSYDIL